MSSTFTRAQRRILLALWLYAIALWIVVLVVFFFVEPGTLGQFLCFLLIPVGSFPAIYVRQTFLRQVNRDSLAQGQDRPDERPAG